MHLRSLWKKYRSAHIALYSKRKMPVFVYQMGKVGSSSVRNSLWAWGVSPVLHLHSFFPLRDLDLDEIMIDDGYKASLREEIDEAKRVYQNFSYELKLEWFMREKIDEMLHKKIVTKKKKAKFITLVREPISTNISMFFQVFERYAGVKYGEADFTTQEIIDIFLNRYTYSRPLVWFDMEMKPALGLDIYEYPFPKEKGYLTIKHDNIELLVLKCELDDSIKENAIAEFLNLDGFKLTRSNTAQNKSYAQQYQEFKQNINLSEAFLETMYNSKYTRHFYSEAELDAFRLKWCCRDKVEKV